MYHTEINTFHNIRISKIKITDLYEFIPNMHECLVNIVYQYVYLFMYSTNKIKFKLT